jgi:hypothetical protein
MRDDIKIYVLDDTRPDREPAMVIRVRSLDGMKEEVTISAMDMMRCENVEAESKLFREAIRDLANMTILPYEDLIRAVTRLENGEAMRRFVERCRPPKLETVPKPKPEPPPLPDPPGGWAGFMSNLGKSILKSDEEKRADNPLPRMRVVKGGKE